MLQLPFAFLRICESGWVVRYRLIFGSNNPAIRGIEGMLMMRRRFERSTSITQYISIESNPSRDILARKKVKRSYVGTALVLEGETSIFHVGVCKGSQPCRFRNCLCNNSLYLFAIASLDPSLSYLDPMSKSMVACVFGKRQFN